MKTESGKMKIRLKGLDKPATFVYPWAKSHAIEFNSDGIAEVPNWIGSKLLGPEFSGVGYEVVEEDKEDKIEKVKKKSKEEDFLSSITN